MDQPKRKQIRLNDYDYSKNNAYFITICTYNRVHLFGEIVNTILSGRPHDPDKMILKWLFEIENKYLNAKIDKFVIMPDHIHFILFNPGDYIANTGAHTGAPLHNIIKWFKTMTTNEYIAGVINGSYPPFDKHIWQRNYYEHIIRNMYDYQEICKYILENPIKWESEKNQPV